nr:hypothetical protein [Tanacetum cinerariifolium]
RSRADPTLLNDFEMAAEGNGDLPVSNLRTMEELCQPSLNGREIAALKAEMVEINKNLRRVLQVNQQVKAVTPNCETCGGPHSYNDCPATVGQTQNVYAAGAYQGGNSYQPQEIAALKAEMVEINKNLRRVLQVNQQVKAVTPNCETCGGPHSYNDCPATVGQTQNVYAAGAYQGGNSYQPQGNRNLLSYLLDNYLGPPGFNQNQNRNNQNQNFITKIGIKEKIMIFLKGTTKEETNSSRELVMVKTCLQLIKPRREQGCRIVRVKLAVTALTERVTELERDNQMLRGTVSVESQRVDRLQHGMSQEQEVENEGNENGGNGGNGNGDNGGNDNGRNGGNEDNGNHGMNYGGFMPMARECTFQDFLKCKPHAFLGTEGVVGLTRWFEKMETVFNISNCPPKYQVKYATCTLQNSALTWWNSHKRTICVDAAYAMKWAGLIKLMTEVYSPRNENVSDEEDRVERFIGGLLEKIQGNVIAANPARLQDAIRIANQLMDKKLQGVENARRKMPNTRSRASMTHEEVEELIARRVAEEIEAHEVARNLEALNENKEEQEVENEGNENGGNGGNGNGDNGGNENGRNGGNEDNGNHGMNYGGFMPMARECTFQDFLKCKPHAFLGTEGVVGLTRWFEKMETVFNISNCPPKYQVKYATCTLQNSALTWWNSHKRTICVDAAYAMKWDGLIKLMTEVYSPRNENVSDEEDRVERFIRGLLENIQGNVIAANPARLQDAIRIANQLMDKKL